MIVGLPRDRAESIATRRGRRAQIGEGARPRAPRGRATTQRSIFVRFALDFGNNGSRGRDPSRACRPFAVSSLLLALLNLFRPNETALKEIDQRSAIGAF